MQRRIEQQNYNQNPTTDKSSLNTSLKSKTFHHVRNAKLFKMYFEHSGIENVSMQATTTVLHVAMLQSTQIHTQLWRFYIQNCY